MAMMTPRQSFIMWGSMHFAPRRWRTTRIGRSGRWRRWKDSSSCALENGRSVLCLEVDARGRQFWELNNPEDVARIEAMMQEMGLD